MTITLLCIGYASVTLYTLFRGHYGAIPVIMVVGMAGYVLGALYAFNVL